MACQLKAEVDRAGDIKILPDYDNPIAPGAICYNKALQPGAGRDDELFRHASWHTGFFEAFDKKEIMMASLMDRMIRAAKLDVHLYEEVEADTGAMGQAMGVVVLSSVAAGIGSIASGGLGGILMGTIAALVGWYVWAYLAYIIGTKLLPEPQTKADHGELLRTVGFSSSPGLIRVLGVIPGLAPVVFLASGIWMLVAMVIAVRQALDYTSTLRAVGVCLIGWVIQVIILGLLFSLFGGGAG